MATIYQGVLHDRFDDLAPALREFLASDSAIARGRMTVTRAGGLVRRLAAWALGIPPAGDHELLLEVTPHGSGLRWTRHFGNCQLTTLQSAWRGLIIERKGLASLGFELVVARGRLYFKPRRAWILGVPMPLFLSPSIDAENWDDEAGGWHVRVVFRAPLLGQVAAYEGVARAASP